MTARPLLPLFAVVLSSCTMIRDYKNAIIQDRSSEALSLAQQSEEPCRHGSTETGSTVPADSILPAERLRGPHFRVKHEVKSDGINYYFEVESDAGAFSAYGISELESFLSEVPAAVELNKLGSVSQASDAAVSSATGSAKSAYRLLSHPMETAGRIPQAAEDLYKEVKELVSKAAEIIGDVRRGISRGGGKVSRETRERYKTEGLDLAKRWADDYVGYAENKRELAARYEVDPYSNNPLIQSELRRLASAGLAGKTAATFVPKVPYLNYASTAEKLLWRRSSKDLAGELAAKYQAAGISKLTATKLVTGESFTPTQQIRLAEAFLAFGDAQGKEKLALSLVNIENRSFANLLVDSYQLLARVGRARGGFVRLDLSRAMPYGVTRSGAVLVPNAADNLSWIEAVCGFFGHAQSSLKGSPKILYCKRPVSRRFAAEAAKLGWVVQTEPR